MGLIMWSLSWNFPNQIMVLSFIKFISHVANFSSTNFHAQFLYQSYITAKIGMDSMEKHAPLSTLHPPSQSVRIMPFSQVLSTGLSLLLPLLWYPFSLFFLPCPFGIWFGACQSISWCMSMSVPLEIFETWLARSFMPNCAHHNWVVTVLTCRSPLLFHLAFISKLEKVTDDVLNLFT